MNLPDSLDLVIKCCMAGVASRVLLVLFYMALRAAYRTSDILDLFQ